MSNPTGDALAANERAVKRREAAAQSLSVYFCVIAGVEPIDSTDGSPNWWMFSNEAKRIYDDLVSRFPQTE